MGKRIAGTKQTLRALEEGTVTRIFLAQDADDALKQRILAAAGQVPVEMVASKKELGKACQVAVPTAVAAEN